MRAWTARAASKSFRSAASTICTISVGISFDATEMIPRPPTAINGSVRASSPDSTTNSGGTASQTSHICVMFPDASFTPTTFGIAASRTSVFTSMLTPVRPGTLYSTMGSGVLSAMARKCWNSPSGVGLL